MDGSGEVNAIEQHRDAKSLLFNPHTYDPSHFDDATSLLKATIDWFEHRGKETLRKPRRVFWQQTSWSSSPRSIVREDGHAVARGERRPRQALGHQQDLGVQ